MIYTEDFVEAAMPLLFDYSATVQVAKEEGMPSSGADPRKATDPHVMMIDIRRAWDECTWLTFDQRQAMLSYALLGTCALAQAATGVSERTIEYRMKTGITALVDYLNSTSEQRAEWEAMYALPA